MWVPNKKTGWQLLAIVFVCLFCHSTVVAQGVVYANGLYKAAGTSAMLALGNTADGSTNTYVLGGFSSATTINGTTYNNASGWPNILVMKFKYGATNAPQWVKTPVTDYTISNARIVGDNSGNSLVAGGFGGTNLTFGTTTITNFGNSGDHSADIFLVKYDVNGNFKFLTQAGGDSDDTLGGLAIDTGGNCYLTGLFQSSTFQAGTSNLVRQSTSGGDCFIAKYNSSGSLTWIEQGSYASGNCIAFDSANNSYVGGTLLGPAVFNGLSPSNQITTNFLAKYTSAGTLVWVRGDITIGQYLKIDSGQNIYTAGTFSNSVQFGSIILTNNSVSTIFVAKYDPNGNILWATQLPGLGDDNVTGFLVDSRTNCWVSGYFASADSPTNTVVAVARYDLSGNLSGITQVSRAQMSLAGGIAGSTGGPFTGSIWIAGSYATNFTMSSKYSLANSGNMDIFAAWVMVLPQVTTMATGTNFVTTWLAADSAGFVMETNSDLSSTNWNSIGGGSLVNGQLVITNPLLPGLHLFRLRKTGN